MDNGVQCAIMWPWLNPNFGCSCQFAFMQTKPIGLLWNNIETKNATLPVLECSTEYSLSNLPIPSNRLLLFFVHRAEKTEVLSDDLLQVRTSSCGGLLVCVTDVSPVTGPTPHQHFLSVCFTMYLYYYLYCECCLPKEKPTQLEYLTPRYSC